ncbi:MAG: DUF4861 family protein [Candidatus Marinimicrobia bacterium]|nr:DUF4861 family protein [Candidatus Neomarinimicrobiota bacterium]
MLKHTALMFIGALTGIVWTAAAVSAETVCVVLENPLECPLKNEPCTIKIGDIGFSRLADAASIKVFAGEKEIVSQVDDIDETEGISPHDLLCFAVDIPPKGEVSYRISTSADEVRDLKEAMPAARSENGRNWEIKCPVYGAAVRRQDGCLQKIEIYHDNRAVNMTGYNPFGVNLTLSHNRKNYCWSTYAWKGTPPLLKISAGPVRTTIRTLYSITADTLPSYSSDKTQGAPPAPMKCAGMQAFIEQLFCFYPDGRLDIRWQITNNGKEALQPLVRPRGWYSFGMRYDLVLPENYRYSASFRDEKGKNIADLMKTEDGKVKYEHAAGWYDFAAESGGGIGVALRMDNIAGVRYLPRDRKDWYLLWVWAQEKSLAPNDKLTGGLRIFYHDPNFNPRERLVPFLTPLKWRRTAGN